MDCMIKHIKIIERMDQLIRLQATGSPEKFAQRLGISKTKLYRMIKLMRALNAPIEYGTTIQSYVYTEVVGFTFGFYSRR
ncbi:HTH domain-containing protein [Aquimarina sp. AU58]|uniref:HTH domain-containing protein n=1 Tax=Aquimarina sp. AU58 TaxID=1874112 RepID=UPI000D6E11FD|nr:HTH domain-containing protein [Aquimarina sp. AU58]